MSMRHPNTEYFYLNAIRNQTIVFMSLFKNMKVVDTTDDADGTLSSSKETDIDIVYAARERKLIEQTYEFLTPDAMYDTKVPRFSVSITSINYDPTRALNFYRTRRIKQNSQLYNDRMPVPYDIGINLSILAKYEGHIFQIAENIVPFFAPYILVKMKENITYLHEVPRELRIDFDGTINKDIPIQWADTERRTVMGDLNFVIKGWIYKPLSEAPGPILHIPIRFFKTEDFDLSMGLFDQTEVSGPNWS